MTSLREKFLWIHMVEQFYTIEGLMRGPIIPSRGMRRKLKRVKREARKAARVVAQPTERQKRIEELTLGYQLAAVRAAALRNMREPDHYKRAFIGSLLQAQEMQLVQKAWKHARLSWQGPTLQNKLHVNMKVTRR